MEPTLLSLLDSIPQKSPRSKLENHHELIRQLRRKGCTYRDIVRILRERVGLARLSQLRPFFGFFALSFIVKPCVFIVGL